MQKQPVKMNAQVDRRKTNKYTLFFTSSYNFSILSSFSRTSSTSRILFSFQFLNSSKVAINFHYDRVVHCLFDNQLGPNKPNNPHNTKDGHTKSQFTCFKTSSLIRTWLFFDAGIDTRKF